MDDDTHEAMLRTEFGGMCEVLADLADVTGTDRYADLARRFLDRSLLGPLTEHRDVLDGMHANTQIAKAVGYQRLGEVDGDPGLRDAARFFWQTMARHRTYSFGGNSVREHLHPRDDFSSAFQSPEGPETCNTYNMLKLSRALFLEEPDAEVLDHYERATVNHILSSLHPKGGLVYFTPVRPGHYRVVSTPRTASGAASAPGWKTTRSTASWSTPPRAATCSSTSSSPPASACPNRTWCWSRPGRPPTTTRSNSSYTGFPPPRWRSTYVSPAGTKGRHTSVSTVHRPRTDPPRSRRAAEQADSL